MRGGEAAIAPLVLVVSFAYLCLFRSYTTIEPDEGIILQGAERILHGQVPYRDFFSYLAPGSCYLLAAVFKAFGDSFTVARTLVAFAGAVCSAVTYVLARRVCGRGVALGTAALVTLTALPYRFLVLHNWDSTLWACLAVYCAVKGTESGESGVASRESGEGSQKAETRNQKTAIGNGQSPIGNRWWAFALGTFVALTGLFEQSKGAGLALGLALGFAILAAARRRGFRDGVAIGRWRVAREGPVASGREEGVRRQRLGGEDKSQKSGVRNQIARSPDRSITRWPNPGFLTLGLAWPVAVTLTWFAAHHALAPMFSDLLWPLRHYTLANRVPYGWMDWNDAERAQLFGNSTWMVNAVAALTVFACFLIPAMPLVAEGVLVGVGLRVLGGGSRESGVGSRNAGMLRSAQDDKSGYYLIVTAVIGGLLLSVVAVRADILHFVYLAPLFYLVLAWALEGRGVPGTLFRALRPAVRAVVGVTFGLLAAALLMRAVTARTRIPTRRGAVEARAADAVIPYVEAHVAAGASLLVYPYLPLYNYLTGTLSPTPYEYIQPGMHTPEQMAEVVRDLEREPRAAVLYEYGFAEKIPSSWPETPVEAIANDPVGDYLMENYRPCRVLHSPTGWQFLFMVRKGTKCPGD